MTLHQIDINVFIAYVVGLLILALWVSRGEKSHETNTDHHSKFLYQGQYERLDCF